MRIVITLLSLSAALLAFVSLCSAMIATVVDDHSGLRWSRVQLADAALMIFLALLAAALVWVQPGMAEAMLWTVAMAGTLGVLIEGGLLANLDSHNLPASLAAASILVNGAAPAVFAAAAALLTHFVLLPQLFGLAS